ncbi:MAG: patatin-like phospholipase family protein [Myxococcota bacterium]
MSTPKERPKRAVVFSGGGARGAYEAGVVRYLVEALPRRLGKAPRFDIICGTSVGAVHACFLAGSAHQGEERGQRLVDFWRSMRIQEILPLGRRDLLELPRRLLGLRRRAKGGDSDHHPERLYGLFDTSALERLVLRSTPWRSIHPNIKRGLVEAVCVAATEISTGRVAVFLESAAPTLPGWTRDPSVVAVPTRLGPSHALASAAIPLLFPAVRIDGAYYADGGLRLNTPLAPALRLGADRVLVVTLQPSAQTLHEAALTSADAGNYSSPTRMFGKLLNSVMLDHLDTDLARMQLMNEMLGDGIEAFGPDFLPRLNRVAGERRGQRFRIIDELVIRPSADLGALAVEVLESMPHIRDRSLLFRLAMRGIEEGEASAEPDLLSYLLFDGDFVAPLAELGFRDAQQREEELLAFFSDEPGATGP